MEDAPIKGNRDILAAPLIASTFGFFSAIALLLGIMGGYLLGSLLLVLGMVMIPPVIGAVSFTRWVMRPLAVGGVGTISLSPGEAFPSEVAARTIALAPVDILGQLSHEELDRIAAIGRRVKLPLGSMLARQGDQGKAIYIILEGQVQLTCSSPQGEVTVRIAGSGESLPLAALLGSGQLLTNAYA